MQIEELWTSLENSIKDLQDKANRLAKKDIEEIKSLSARAYEVLKVLNQLEWLESNKMEWNGELIEETAIEIEEEVLLEEEPELEIEEEVEEAVKEIEEHMEDVMKMVMPSMPSVPKVKSTKEPVQSLAEKLSQSKVEDLTKAFGISEKFLFMNELFEGDSEEYKEALNNLNSFSSWSEAEKELMSLSSKYGWDHENEFVNRFTSMVERRYA